jgi:hypothetical protein
MLLVCEHRSVMARELVEAHQVSRWIIKRLTSTEESRHPICQRIKWTCEATQGLRITVLPPHTVIALVRERSFTGMSSRFRVVIHNRMQIHRWIVWHADVVNSASRC